MNERTNALLRRGAKGLAFTATIFLALLVSPTGLGQSVPGAQAPFVHHDLYPEASEASKDIATALREARQQHKRVLLVFGGNWCSDCYLLNNKLHDATNGPILDRYYILVHVNVGHMDENVELAHQYGIPLTHGVPGVSIVTGSGKVVHAQPNGQLGDVRRMDAGGVTQFLTQWKG